MLGSFVVRGKAIGRWKVSWVWAVVCVRVWAGWSGRGGVRGESGRPGAIHGDWRAGRVSPEVRRCTHIMQRAAVQAVARVWPLVLVPRLLRSRGRQGGNVYTLC
jgi:hypothetical protein